MENDRTFVAFNENTKEPKASNVQLLVIWERKPNFSAKIRLYCLLAGVFKQVQYNSCKPPPLCCVHLLGGCPQDTEVLPHVWLDHFFWVSEFGMAGCCLTRQKHGGNRKLNSVQNTLKSLKNGQQKEKQIHLWGQDVCWPLSRCSTSFQVGPNQFSLTKIHSLRGKHQTPRLTPKSQGHFFAFLWAVDIRNTDRNSIWGWCFEHESESGEKHPLPGSGSGKLGQKPETGLMCFEHESGGREKHPVICCSQITG